MRLMVNGYLAMCSTGERFLYLCLSLSCFIVAGIGFVNMVMPFMVWFSLAMGLILFWLPTIIDFTYDEA